MADNAHERRQVPRLEVQDVACRIELRTRVRLMDISASGALLATETPLPVGTSAVLKSGLAASAFTPQVQIRRQASPPPRTPALALGAIFTEMDDRSRRSLAEFLKKATE
jgi:hypothetical protein